MTCLTSVFEVTRQDGSIRRLSDAGASEKTWIEIDTTTTWAFFGIYTAREPWSLSVHHSMKWLSVRGRLHNANHHFTVLFPSMALFHLRMPISSFFYRHFTPGTTRVSVIRCIAHMKSFQATQSFANTILCGETLTYIGRLSYSG